MGIEDTDGHEIHRPPQRASQNVSVPCRWGAVLTVRLHTIHPEQRPNEGEDIMKIIDRTTGHAISTDDLADILYQEGPHIIPGYIEEIARGTSSGEYYILDTCGHAVWLDPKRWEVRE